MPYRVAPPEKRTPPPPRRDPDQLEWEQRLGQRRRPIDPLTKLLIGYFLILAGLGLLATALQG